MGTHRSTGPRHCLAPTLAAARRLPVDTGHAPLTRRDLLQRSFGSLLALAPRHALAGGWVSDTDGARVWLSTEDLRFRLTELPRLEWQSPRPGDAVVDIKPAEAFQEMLGFGSSLEPATCWNLSRMSRADREQVLAQLVGAAPGIGMNLMRVCMGTPDFTGDAWYSYDDLPAGETDPDLSRFSIERDRTYILDVLRLARATNPDLRFFASPWSPPGWMKTTGTMIGGSLLPRWSGAYAEYFVKFIRAYEAEGIPVFAVTIQNEPGVDRSLSRNPAWHYPSCRWTAEQERDFIRDHLGPAFRRHGMATRIRAQPPSSPGSPSTATRDSRPAWTNSSGSSPPSRCTSPKDRSSA